MSTHDSRLAVLEKDVAVMKQDIIYKLDDTNSAVTMIQGIVGVQGRDLKHLINQAKLIDIRLEGLTQEMRTLQEQQNVQGQDIKDIKRRLDGSDQRLDGIDQRLGGIDQRLDGIDQRFTSIDQRLEGIDHRFTSLEEKFDRRFEQVLQALATLTDEP